MRDLRRLSTATASFLVVQVGRNSMTETEILPLLVEYAH